MGRLCSRLLRIERKEVHVTINVVIYVHVSRTFFLTWWLFYNILFLWHFSASKIPSGINLVASHGGSYRQAGTCFSKSRECLRYHTYCFVTSRGIRIHGKYRYVHRQNVRQIQTLKIARTSGYRTDKLMYVLNL